MLDRKEANKDTKKGEVLALANKVEQVDRRDSNFVLPFASCEFSDNSESHGVKILEKITNK